MSDLAAAVAVKHAIDRYLTHTAGIRHRLRALTLQALPWTIAQADEAESLVRQIRAASIVARNAGADDTMTDLEARRAMR